MNSHELATMLNETNKFDLSFHFMNGKMIIETKDSESLGQIKEKMKSLIEEKVCVTCKKSKPIEEFPKRQGIHRSRHCDCCLKEINEKRKRGSKGGVSSISMIKARSSKLISTISSYNGGYFN